MVVSLKGMNMKKKAGKKTKTQKPKKQAKVQPSKERRRVTKTTEKVTERAPFDPVEDDDPDAIKGPDENNNEETADEDE
jgi:hypothetical protein